MTDASTQILDERIERAISKRLDKKGDLWKNVLGKGNKI